MPIQRPGGVKGVFSPQGLCRLGTCHPSIPRLGHNGDISFIHIMCAFVLAHSVVLKADGDIRHGWSGSAQLRSPGMEPIEISSCFSSDAGSLSPRAIKRKLDFPKGRGADFRSTDTAKHPGGQYSATAVGPAVGMW